MEHNAGFYDAFKNFVGMLHQPAILTRPERYHEMRNGDFEKQFAAFGERHYKNSMSTTSENNDFDFSENPDGLLNSPSDSVYDSDYSDSGFPLPCASDVKNNVHILNNSHSVNQGPGFEESSVDYSNTCNSYSSSHSDENVMEGEIFINGDFENNPSFESAVASVVQEFENDSSNEDGNESNSLEAIFVPLKSISPDCAISPSCIIPSCDIKVENSSTVHKMKVTNILEESSSMIEGNSNCCVAHIENGAFKLNNHSFNNSSNKENHHCNMQSASTYCVMEEGPKVVVEVAPSRDISLTEISALRNIDGDSESYREDGVSSDITPASSTGYCKQQDESKTLAAECNPVSQKDVHHHKHSSNQHQTFAMICPENKAKGQNRHDLDFRIFKGDGVKLRYIPRISAEIADAPPDITQAVHNILYDAPGNCKNRTSRALTKRNILNFSGFPFGEHSKEYEIKKIRLSRMPFQIMCDVSYIFLGANIVNKCDMIEKVLHFLLKPTSCWSGEGESKKKYNRKNVNKEDLQSHPSFPKARHCSVVLERMNEEDIQRKIKETSEGKYSMDINKQNVTTATQQPNNSSKDCSLLTSPYSKPSFIETGEREKLRQLPGVAKNLQNVSEKIIHMLHVVFYGTTQECETSKFNILEFSGFSPCQNDRIELTQKFMNKLTIHDLRTMCRVLSLEPAENNKPGMITCLLNFFKTPSVKLMRTNRTGARGRGRVCTEFLQKRLKKTGKEIQPNTDNTEINDVCKELKAFGRIRTNIECATPEDLLELHDVIFAKSCESYQIHQKILRFNGFSFNESSPDYQFRKTLMQYMSFESVIKMASLLDLPGSDMHQCYQQDLCTSILKFLLKPSVATLNELNRIAGSIRSHSNRMESYLGLDTPPSENSLQSFHQHPQEERSMVQLGAQFTSHDNHNLAVKLSKETSCHLYNDQQKKRPFNYVDDSRFYGNELLSVSTNFFSSSHCGTPKKRELYHSSSSEDEFEVIPLATFISHPSDSDLKQVIQEIIEASVQSISMKGLINAVYSRYPDFDLRYRANFIRAKARKVLSKMHRTAQNSVMSSSHKSICFSYN